ncbi:MAG TPA: hypothetical protein VED46_10620, partial [Alphaproteobacteria bacterium]|nr:hypothetical protein [Alphaproteobacteria bacterium]
GSSFNANGDDGIEFFRSTIASGVVTPHAGTSLTTGFALKDSQVIGNAVDGVDFNEVMATDVTIKNTIVAANTGAGVIVFDSDFTDFAIQNSYLGVAPNPLGGTFSGNGGEGFLGELSNFTGAAFFDSFFNGNGVGGNADGIEFELSTITSGVVSLHDPSMTLTAGFALKNSQVVGNLAHGVEFDGTTATDVTIKNTIVAANFGNGVLVGNDSILTDFAIQDSYLGAAPNPLGGTFTGNGFGGFSGENSTFTGTAFFDSVFNGNLGGDGINFFSSTILSGAVTPHAGTPITAGFALIGSEVAGNGGNGVDILSMIDDVVFDGGTVIAGNGGGVGINVIATGAPGTDGSILFGNTTITDNMTGILVENADAQAPLLLTFGPTTINGGADALVLSGAGLALTGGGGMIPGGSLVGGGMMPGDGLFGGSLGTLSFNGQTGTFVTLMNGALFDPGMPTVIDASNVTFNGTPADMLDDMQRQDVMNRIIDFNDDMTLGLIFLPPAVVQMVPSPAENPGLIDELPGKENTPGDTLFRLTGGLEFNPDPGEPNAFCTAYSLGQTSVAGDSDTDDVVCAILPSTPTPVTPNQGLNNFWQGWQAARR